VENKVDISIIVGSRSDLVLLVKAVKILTELGVSYSLNIASAHRSSFYLRRCIRIAESLAAKVFIVVAGMAAALPGVVASETILPVIGVPVSSKNFSSLDSLFSIVQMPEGVPVATVTVGESGAVNAVILALQIISVGNEDLRDKLKTHRAKMSEIVVEEDLKLQRNGLEKFVEDLKSKC
jgi:5-(carboxyamino)imidazole ribonucleotide mutase